MHGLPEDVFRLIASALSVGDIGRASRVCKTWRRLAASDAVWRAVAQREGLALPAGVTDVRTHVAHLLVVTYAPPRFREMPPRPECPVEIRVMDCFGVTRRRASLLTLCEGS